MKIKRNREGRKKKEVKKEDKEKQRRKKIDNKGSKNISLQHQNKKKKERG